MKTSDNKNKVFKFSDFLFFSVLSLLVIITMIYAFVTSSDDYISFGCNGNPPGLVSEEDEVDKENVVNNYYYNDYNLPTTTKDDEVYDDEYTKYYIQSEERSMKDRLEDKRLFDSIRSKERWN